MEQKYCPFCHIPIQENYYFCPNCGKKLQEPPLTRIKELEIYAISILLPPLGLWPGIRYLTRPDHKSRVVGTIAIVLTILSSIITIWLTMSLINSTLQSTTGQGQQLQQLQNLGY